MSVTTANLARGTQPTLHDGDGDDSGFAEIVIGKDILELVSSAMYIDPMTVYREYVQNAADAVDFARRTGMLAGVAPGRVDISVDPGNRTVRIRDNGCGIPSSRFYQQLTALGGSEKRGTAARGFRGVGRLAGLAYSQELVFRSRVAGEPKISEVTWDCRQLKVALQDPADHTNVADLIRRVTTLQRVEADGMPERFFEVEMRGIIRLRNDTLLARPAISTYLSQVAPVPFSPDFRFGPEISKAVSRHTGLTELDIRIDGCKEPIYRPHCSALYLDGKPALNFNDLNVIEIPSADEGVGAVAWVLHHEYQGALPTEAGVKGLRLRMGNMQVGGHNLLEDLFPEPRFNSWSVGEVHVVDRRIVPNGRRDHFEQNIHFHNLANHLTPAARDIARRCRTSSVRRKLQREFELHAQSVAETLSIILQGSTNQQRRKKLALAADKALLQMEQIAHKESLADTLCQRIKKIDTLRTQLGDAMNDGRASSSPLMRLPKTQRLAYEQFFELIYDCSVNRVAAKALIDRILLRIE